jgi:hypothetical protein
MTDKQYVFQDGDNITIDSDGSITYTGKHANKARKIINNVLKKCMLPETPKNVIHLIDRIVVPLEQGMVIFG